MAPAVVALRLLAEGCRHGVSLRGRVEVDVVLDEPLVARCRMVVRLFGNERVLGTR